MYKSKNILYPIIALLTVVIWDTIFVSTKVLINEGLSPVEILLYHFIIPFYFSLFMYMDNITRKTLG